MPDTFEKHLEKCTQYAAFVAQPVAHPEQIFRLLVQDLEGKGYWLFLEMKSSAPLAQLDQYLRTIWLDCCSHGSEFTDDGFGSKEYSNDQTAARVFAPGRSFVHLYDFGFTSETGILVLGVHNGGTAGDHPITLLARNKAPVYICQAKGCHAIATNVCPECAQGDNLPRGALCDAHSRVHHEHTLLPICNSPRSGVCGYRGPDQPPYGLGRTEPLDEGEEDEQIDIDPLLLDALLTLGLYSVDQLKFFLRANHLRLTGHKADLEEDESAAMPSHQAALSAIWAWRRGPGRQQ
ncbi:hypothetical protein PAPYR_7958 [Paratrimastix pyriformis]|uniref:Uncharacterized protein n=1 Tax=Paratrimastix pyriformis TaxID=342808 RepID=A0ABQ8UE78_9EUKA|nr:hypothetical protein PAPYR_7958 [Paratrimastix pyriformis]